MDWLTDPQAWIAFFTLVALELVLGVDNVIFISILASKLPAAQQQRARVTGLGMAEFSNSISSRTASPSADSLRGVDCAG